MALTSGTERGLLMFSAVIGKGENKCFSCVYSLLENNGYVLNTHMINYHQKGRLHKKSNLRLCFQVQYNYNWLYFKMSPLNTDQCIQICKVKINHNF